MLISNGCSCSTSFPKRVPGLRARDDWQVGLVNLPNKILHVLSRALPADNRSKARVCVRHDAEYLLRLQYTSLSNFMTGDFDTWWMNACPSLSNVTLQEPAGFLSPNLVVNMRAFIDVKFVVRTQFRWKILLFSKAVLLNKFPRKGRAIMKRMTFWISKFRYYKIAKDMLNLIQAELSTIMKYLRCQKGKIKILKKKSKYLKVNNI